MAAKRAAKKVVKKTAGRKKRRGVKLVPTELTASELAVDGIPSALGRAALTEREQRAELILQLDDAVNAAVAKLKDKGLQSH